MTTPRAADPDTLSGRMASEIRSLLGRYNVNRSELARRLGKEPWWVSKRLNGETEIGTNDAERIARALGVNVVDLLPRGERQEKVTASDPVPHGPKYNPMDALPVRVPVARLPAPRERRAELTGR
jgi:transcriptional regulator with XRE-family HTH domain